MMKIRLAATETPFYIRMMEIALTQDRILRKFEIKTVLVLTIRKKQFRKDVFHTLTNIGHT